MTLYDSGRNTAQKRQNMAAILTCLIQNGRRRRNGRKWNQLRFCLQGYKDAKKKKKKKKPLGSSSIGNFALDYITPCTICVLM